MLLSAGDADLSFGTSGQVTTEFSTSTAWGTTVLATALQSDGRIVACGEGAVARYLSDGSLDVSFGVGGEAAFPYFARSVAIQADGRILVAGGTDGLPNQDFAATQIRCRPRIHRLPV